MLIMLSFAGGKVSPFDIIPLLWYQMILAVFTIGYIFYNPKES